MTRPHQFRGRQTPLPPQRRMRAAGGRIAPGYPAERFRKGQDVAMISDPANMGHVVGFDPDGSVMVQWHGGRAVSGVDPRNLRGLPPGYAGRRASEPRRRRYAREGGAPSESDIDEMFDAYVETALWSSTDEDGTPLDSLDAVVADRTLASMRQDVESFARENAHLIESADVSTRQYGRWGRAGHDFWLTRNGHGAGFWDGDWEPKTTAKQLTDAAHAYGEVYLYVGDDGMIDSD